ncbi:MAG: AI-2E family transporter [Gammaproteobacteria bacterium]|nr:AI-2E family transporter [Gammaproteobacteria bacterium]
MIDMLKTWYYRHFSNPQAVILALILVSMFAIVIYMGEILLPLLIAIVIAYLLEALVWQLTRRKIKRKFAMPIVFALFLVCLVVGIVGLVPLLVEQIVQFIEELPKMISSTQKALLQLPEQFPHLISEEQVRDIMKSIAAEVAKVSQAVLSYSLASLRGVITWMVYLILIVLLVFFFLKDKYQIVLWSTRYLPRDRGLVTQVWREMDEQIGNYIRGKIVEIIIVGFVTYLVFALMGMNYSVLLGLLVGLSVLVPFVGATVVTIPVALVAFFQWGWTPEFFYLIIAYGIVQALDGNVLVPLLFSEAVNLHPVAIIVAIIFFGGVWGFWGIFFAIPLATLVKAVLNAWPKNQDENKESAAT